MDVRLESGAFGRAAVPSGASTGVHEAVELRDGGTAWGGKGTTAAVANVNGVLRAAVVGRDAQRPGRPRRRPDRVRRHPEQGAARRQRDPRHLARRREGRCGRRRRLALPSPGRRRRAHAARADAERDQRRRPCAELDRPAGVHGRPGRRRLVRARACSIGVEVYHALKGVLHERGLATAVGDEGGFAPDLASSEAAIEAILEAAERAGVRDRIAIALDPATSEVYRDGAYRFEGRTLDADELIASGSDLVGRYPIVSIEDGAAEDDWDAWSKLTRDARRPVQLVGDDLFVTNPERLQRGIDERRRQLDPGQGQPDRHADRDARGDRAGAARRLHRRHLAPLRRDGGHDDRRPRGRAPTPARSRPARPPAPIASPSTTSCCGSRRSSASGPCIPAGRRSRGRTVR